MDIIIISCGKNELNLMTQQTIDSLRRSEDLDLNIIIVESESVSYQNCLTIKYDGLFNYNKLINIGLSHCHDDIVTFCNNDLIFHKHWLTSHIKVFKEYPEIHSLSPKCDMWKDGSIYQKHKNFNKGIYLGFRTGFEIAGWCITVRREIINKIGGLDTTNTFWYSDNNYAMQLMKHNFQHALNADSTVTHLFGKSSNLLSPEEFRQMTTGQKNHFLRRWNIISM